MKNRSRVGLGVLVGVVAFIVIALVFYYFFQRFDPYTDQAEPTIPIEVELPAQIKDIFTRITLPLYYLPNNKIIIDELVKYNDLNKDLTSKEIALIDNIWQKSQDTDDFSKQFKTNSIAKELIRFQEIYPEFTEIFISDMRGLVVGMTHKTSDYLQSDEEWWVNSLKKNGQSFHGEFEYDESSQTEAIAVYLPMVNQNNAKVIGVIKVIVTIDSIKAEL
ncbi:TPA: hypothetical protein DD455_03655 [Candidatus Shapirobacteria bacterium]|nr:hypothetical protein [Candidatus Shapirobacteria bacterium]